jgi:hypothetical protein
MKLKKAAFRGGLFVFKAVIAKVQSDLAQLKKCRSEPAFF